ncbi:MAG: nudix-type nucleoside diphosphatase (YffH/AdpP family) [Yoonia sp.]|jgi:nudix-type nucleoside diphosphatase (YffH/AdpP family)
MQIFVYGTLQSSALCHAVAGGGHITQVPATLADYGILPVAQNVVPLIRAKVGAVTSGAILLGVTPEQLHRLDTYEGAFGYALIDVTVQTDGGPATVKMYLPPNDIAVGDGDWSLSQWIAKYEPMAVLAATELFAHKPPLNRDQIARNWPMIEKRAWAKQAARGQGTLASLRHDAVADDFIVISEAPPKGDFFRIQQMNVQYRQFDGTQSDVVPREVFVGIDAALVLPYDPKRDRILLIEQIRMGPIVRQDPNPWVLEPIAGMIDATETPDQSALRESVEEAGLSDMDLRHLSSFYPSPGSSTDYFHAYLGLCDLPDDHAKFGGLDTEAEDLRLHILSFDRAMKLVASGEINAGPLVMMLCMLGMQRDALRSGG